MEVMMKKSSLFLSLIFLFSMPALAQENTLQLRLNRDWGYGGFAGEIQGRFSLRASGPENLTEVQFIIDDVSVDTVTKPPYNFQFVTDDYPPGAHTLNAIGILSDGSKIKSPKFQRVFLTAEEARNATTKLLIPFLMGIGGITLLATVIPIVFFRKKRFQIKQYGIAGGAVCLRCHLPFSRSVFSPNLLFGKLERCPHCGKWAITKSATSEELELAENRYLDGETNLPVEKKTKDDILTKALDDTRFE